MTKETGGSAFPVRSEKNEYNVEYQGAETGMTLRDWFAGMALQGILSSDKYAAHNPHRAPSMDSSQFSVYLSANAYAWADAMISARSK